VAAGILMGWLLAMADQPVSVITGEQRLER
jgi:hypothetical protein